MLILYGLTSQIAENAGVAVEPPPLVRPAKREQRARTPPSRLLPPPPPKPRSGTVLMEGAREPLSLVKTAVRAEAQRLYGRDCGKVAIPDRAFMPVEITGASNPEYAVLFGRARCENGGIHRNAGAGPADR